MKPIFGISTRTVIEKISSFLRNQAEVTESPIDEGAKVLPLQSQICNQLRISGDQLRQNGMHGQYNVQQWLHYFENLWFSSRAAAVLESAMLNSELMSNSIPVFEVITTGQFRPASSKMTQDFMSVLLNQAEKYELEKEAWSLKKFHLTDAFKRSRANALDAIGFERNSIADLLEGQQIHCGIVRTSAPDVRTEVLRAVDLSAKPVGQLSAITAYTLNSKANSSLDSKKSIKTLRKHCVEEMIRLHGENANSAENIEAGWLWLTSACIEGDSRFPADVHPYKSGNAIMLKIYNGKRDRITFDSFRQLVSYRLELRK